MTNPAGKNSKTSASSMVNFKLGVFHQRLTDDNAKFGRHQLCYAEPHNKTQKKQTPQRTNSKFQQKKQISIKN